MTSYAERLHGGRRAESFPASAPDVAIIADDVCAILGADETMGFVHHTGKVFVALSGNEYDYAVEVGQSLSFDQSVAMVRQCFVPHR